jgi:hypothetical protein
MARDTGGPTLEELLSDFRDATKRWQEEYMEPSPYPSEAYLVKIASILIWLAGLSSCFVLAWWGSGESRLLTTITVIFPLLAWHIFGLWSWALLLPISLMGLLALQGAILLW